MSTFLPVSLLPDRKGFTWPTWRLTDRLLAVVGDAPSSIPELFDASRVEFTLVREGHAEEVAHVIGNVVSVSSMADGETQVIASIVDFDGDRSLKGLLIALPAAACRVLS